MNNIELYGGKLVKTNPDFMFCVTLYNETSNMVIDTLDSIVDRISEIDYLNQRNYTICIIADGLDNIDNSTLNLFKRLGLKKIKKTAELHILVTEYSDVKLYVAIKEKNRGKLNSHWWFYKLFCNTIQPKYCIQIDTGVILKPNSMNEIKNYFDEHDDVGAATIRLMLPDLDNYSDIVKVWHYCDFEVEKNIEWASEQLSGFLTVLPGQCSVVRWSAINHPVQKNYFMGMDSSDPYIQNRFRTEDRVLGCEIATCSKSPKIRFLPNAYAVSNEYEGLTELLNQRKRWVNGHFMSNVWSIPKFISIINNDEYDIKYKSHLILSTIWTIVNALILWIFPALMLITSNILCSGLSTIDSIMFQSVFGISIIFQLYVSAYWKSDIMIAKAFKITGLYQTFLLMFGLITYLLHGDIKLLSIVSLYALEVLNLIYVFRVNTKNKLSKIIPNLIKYSIIRPVFKLVLGINGFMNVHDNSWGTKNIKNNQNKHNNNMYRIKFVTYWILSNILLFTFYFMNNTIVINFMLVLMSIYVLFRVITANYFSIKNRV